MLFDFGLAKLWKIDPDNPALASRKLTGQTGSARYMAPEVLAHLLACLLGHLLTYLLDRALTLTHLRAHYVLLPSS